MARFGEVVTAMVTPFAGDGALDVDAAVELARWLTDHGSDGLVVAGTTGEGPVLSDDEDRELWRAVAEAVTVPVVAGTGTNDTAHSIELTKVAAECGVAGALVVTPYYNRPSQAGLEAHFQAVAGATGLPILIYDIPIRTGRKVSNEVMLRLAREVPTIVGVRTPPSTWRRRPCSSQTHPTPSRCTAAPTTRRCRCWRWAPWASSASPATGRGPRSAR